MHSELVHNLLKNTALAQAVVGTSQTLAACITDDQKAAGSLVNRKSPLLAGSVIDAD